MSQPKAAIHTPDEVLKNARLMGWGVRKGRGSSHWNLTSPSGQMITINIDPGGSRGQVNQTASLRRAGYYEAWDRYCQEGERKRQAVLAKVRASDYVAPERPAAVAAGAYAELTTITPELASSFLERPPALLADGSPIQQRSLSSRWVDEIAGWITRGEWMPTPEGLMFAPDGGVLDGQHRLWAVVQADMPVQMWVWRNVDPAVFHTLNQGKKRTNANVAQTRGYTSAFVLSSSAKLLYCYLGKINDDRSDPRFASFRQWHGIHQSPAQMLRLLGPAIPGDPYSGHGALADSVNPGSAMVGGVVGGVKAAGVVAHYLALSSWNAEGDVDAFAYGIRQGVDPGNELLSPMHTVREWLMRQRTVKDPSKRDFQLLALLVAWKAWAYRRPLKQFRELASKDFEAMPEPRK